MLAAVLLAVAAAMTGSTPPRVGADGPQAPPPLVLRDDEPESSELSAGARELAAGRPSRAANRFAAAAADDPDGVEPQVALALARWNRGGARVVERDLRQLAREYGGDAYIELHLGLVLVYAGDVDAGTPVLRSAMRHASAADAHDLARHADDLLHPDQIPGYPPLLVEAGDATTPTGAEAISRLRAAVASGDREASATVAAELARTHGERDPALQVAVALATYDKQDPGRTVSSLARIRAHGELAADVLLARAVVFVWQGDASRARPLLEQVAADRSAGDAARQARKLLSALPDAAEG